MIELRPLTRADAVRVRGLINRSEAHDAIPRRLSQIEFDEEFDEPNYDSLTDARVALVDGELAGWCRIWHSPSGELLERAYLFGAVDPAFRRRGVGRTMLQWSHDLAIERLSAIDNDLPKYVRVNAYDFLESAQRLFHRFGFVPVRWFEQLLRPLDSIPEPIAPKGIRIIPFSAGRAEAVRAVKNAAFADHWGSTPTGQASWETIYFGHGARPDLSFLAEEIATGQIVAYCLNHCYPEDDDLLGRGDCIIDNLGTIRGWRGRGLASTLINTSLQAFAAEGRTHAMIEVDGDSPTGASRLYRSLGFEPLHRLVTSQIQL